MITYLIGDPQMKHEEKANTQDGSAKKTMPKVTTESTHTHGVGFRL